MITAKNQSTSRNCHRLRQPVLRLRRVPLRISCFIALMCVIWPVLVADDYFVNNETGDNRNNGKVESSYAASGQNGPFRTIGRALQVVSTGDRIFIEKTDQPYRESLSIQGPQHNGTGIKKFHILSNGAILDGTRPVGARWEPLSDDLYRFLPERMSYQQLYLEGKPIPQTKLSGADEVFKLEPGQWTLRGGYIYFCTDGRNPEGFDLTYCYHSVGITLYQVRDVVIEGIVVQGFQLDGVNAHDGVFATTVLNCVLRGNGRSGLLVGGASRVSVIACLIGDNGQAQIRTEGESNTWIENCDLVDSPMYGPPIQQVSGNIFTER